jgi:hypothetical protein
MRRIIIATAGLFIGGAGVLALAVPAFAATTPATTPVTVQITGGGLAISAPVASVSLGSAAASANPKFPPVIRVLGRLPGLWCGAGPGC